MAKSQNNPYAGVMQLNMLLHNSGNGPLQPLRENKKTLNSFIFTEKFAKGQQFTQEVDSLLKVSPHQRST